MFIYMLCYLNILTTYTILELVAKFLSPLRFKSATFQKMYQKYDKFLICFN